MSKLEVTNRETHPSYQFDEVTECWTGLTKAEEYGVFIGVCAYGALPEGKTPEELAHPEAEAELFYVLNGSGYVYLEGKETTELRKGDSFVLPAQPNHQILVRLRRRADRDPVRGHGRQAPGLISPKGCGGLRRDPRSLRAFRAEIDCGKGIAFKGKLQHDCLHTEQSTAPYVM